MKQNLKKSAQQYYEQQKLDNAQLEALQALCAEPADSPAPAKKPYRYYLSAAASIVFLFAMALFIWDYRLETDEDRVMAVVNEVIKEHLEQDPLEIKRPNFPDLKKYFVDLDFSPFPTDRIPGINAVLEGGRYCSIQSVKAAQLRYQSEKKSITLYQVPYTPKLHGKIPDINRQGKMLVRHHRGFEVQLWVEKGILMVTAR
jgi:hypothetical protein